MRSTAMIFMTGLLIGMAFAAEEPKPQIEDPFRVVAELNRLAAQPLWPGFDARRYPVAIYDGERTWLFRHPAPPPPFEPSASHEGVWVAEGRHPAMRSNSKAPIGEVTTATLLLTIEPGRAPRKEASIVIHETFHVFQDERFPGWTANEAYRFTYPVDDTENYLLTLLEDEALARGLETKDVATAAGWAAQAMDLRHAHHARLAEEHRTFELGLEMMEGTAFYVAHLAIDEQNSPETLRETLAPDNFRWRPYATGSAIAALLDRFDPEWKERLDRSRELTLQEMLEAALGRLAAKPQPFAPEELQDYRARADAAVGELVARRTAYRQRFADASAWAVEVRLEPGVVPFELKRLDLVNVVHLGNGEVLHGHWLTLSGPAGTIEMDNPGHVRREYVGLNALSSVAEGHPLFGTIDGVSFVGFEDTPRVTEVEGLVLVEANGLRVDLQGARVERKDRHITITVAAPPVVREALGASG